LISNRHPIFTYFGWVATVLPNVLGSTVTSQSVFLMKKIISFSHLHASPFPLSVPSIRKSASRHTMKPFFHLSSTLIIHAHTHETIPSA